MKKQEQLLITPKFKIDDEIYFLCEETIYKRKITKIWIEVWKEGLFIKYGVEGHKFTYLNESELYYQANDITAKLISNINLTN